MYTSLDYLKEYVRRKRTVTFMKKQLLHLWKSYSAFIDKQGFPLVVTVCVAVITCTALYRADHSEAYVSPTPPVNEHVSAAQLLQQSLRDTVTPSPSPAVSPSRYLAPLDGLNILRAFDTETMYQGSTTGVWMIHDAIDLGCTIGDRVIAMADGTVLSSGHDSLLDGWLLIRHEGQLEALYAGLAFSNDYREGDKVFAGDTIGYIGDPPADEQELGPHLHLRVTRNGMAVDPLRLFDTGPKTDSTIEITPGKK